MSVMVLAICWSAGTGAARSRWNSRAAAILAVLAPASPSERGCWGRQATPRRAGTALARSRRRRRPAQLLERGDGARQRREVVAADLLQRLYRLAEDADVGRGAGDRLERRHGAGQGVEVVDGTAEPVQALNGVGEAGEVGRDLVEGAPEAGRHRRQPLEQFGTSRGNARRASTMRGLEVGGGPGAVPARPTRPRTIVGPCSVSSTAVRVDATTRARAVSSTPLGGASTERGRAGRLMRDGSGSWSGWRWG